MQIYDFFDYTVAPDGTYTILKNGEPFLTCTGSETDAKNLVNLLQEDAEE